MSHSGQFHTTQCVWVILGERNWTSDNNIREVTHEKKRGNLKLYRASCPTCCMKVTTFSVLCEFLSLEKESPFLLARRRPTLTTSRARWPTRSFPSSTRWCPWDGTSSCWWWPTATGRITWPPTSWPTSCATSRRWAATVDSTDEALGLRWPTAPPHAFSRSPSRLTPAPFT